MSRKCVVSGKGVLFGNNVSHANNKTRRRFNPNMQKLSFYSEVLQKPLSLKLSTSGIRTVEHKGGIDAFLISTKASELTPDLVKIQKQILAKKQA